MGFTSDSDLSFRFVYDGKVHTAELEVRNRDGGPTAYYFWLNLDGHHYRCSVSIPIPQVVSNDSPFRQNYIAHYVVKAIRHYGLEELPQELKLGSLDLPFSDLGPQENVDDSVADKTIAQHLYAFFYHEPDRDVRIYDLEVSTCGTHSLVLKRLKFFQIKDIVEVIDDKYCKLAKDGWDKLQALR